MAPLPLELITLKPGAVSRDNDSALGMAHGDTRGYMLRLDEVCPGDWSDRTLSVTINGKKVVVSKEVVVMGVAHSDEGEGSIDDENGATSAAAQAFKRACAKHGLGRYLYDLPQIWFDYDKAKKRWKRTQRSMAVELYTKAGITKADIEAGKPPKLDIQRNVEEDTATAPVEEHVEQQTEEATRANPKAQTSSPSTPTQPAAWQPSEAEPVGSIRLTNGDVQFVAVDHPVPQPPSNGDDYELWAALKHVALMHDASSSQWATVAFCNRTTAINLANMFTSRLLTYGVTPMEQHMFAAALFHGHLKLEDEVGLHQYYVPKVYAKAAYDWKVKTPENIQGKALYQLFLYWSGQAEAAPAINRVEQPRKVAGDAPLLDAIEAVPEEMEAPQPLNELVVTKLLTTVNLSMKRNKAYPAEFRKQIADTQSFTRMVSDLFAQHETLSALPSLAHQLAEMPDAEMLEKFIVGCYQWETAKALASGQPG